VHPSAGAGSSKLVRAASDSSGGCHLRHVLVELDAEAERVPALRGDLLPGRQTVDQRAGNALVGRLRAVGRGRDSVSTWYCVCVLHRPCPAMRTQ
jgi:hypothetical protein